MPVDDTCSPRDTTEHTTGQHCGRAAAKLQGILCRSIQAVAIVNVSCIAHLSTVPLFFLLTYIHSFLDYCGTFTRSEPLSIPGHRTSALWRSFDSPPFATGGRSYIHRREDLTGQNVCALLLRLLWYLLAFLLSKGDLDTTTKVHNDCSRSAERRCATSATHQLNGIRYRHC
jgi:hypothetical protein